MRVAIPIWRGCVSPLFEAAGCLLLLRLARGVDFGRRLIDLADRPPAARAQLLWLEGVEVLICGALSRPVQRMLEANKIEVIGWIRGEVEDVLAAFMQGRLGHPRYQLPGVHRRDRRRRRRRGVPNGRKSRPEGE